MAPADKNNSGKCDKNFVAAVLAIIVGAIVTLATPELRKLFGLEKDKPASPPQVVQPQPLPTPVLPTPEPVVQETPSKPTGNAPPKPATQQPPSANNDNPSGSTEYTLAEHKRQFVKEANTALSFSFESVGGEFIVSLIISPVGKTPLTRAMLNGRSHEFTSSTGVFIVTVLDINWEGKTVAVQVSRKS